MEARNGAGYRTSLVQPSTESDTCYKLARAGPARCRKEAQIIQPTNELPRVSAEDPDPEELERRHTALPQEREYLQRLLEERAELLCLTTFALSKVRECTYVIAQDTHLVLVNGEAYSALDYSAAELHQMCVTDINPTRDVKIWNLVQDERCHPGPLLPAPPPQGW